MTGHGGALAAAVGLIFGSAAAAQTWSNTTSLAVPDSGSATPYPSAIAVSGVSGSVTKVTVTLDKINHTYPDDLDILLVGPAGQKVVLMSDCGGNPDLVNKTLTFDDAASSSLPDATLIASGTYKPTNFDTSDGFPTPAPGGPYASTLSAFVGSDPNGTWSLYVVDDAGVDSGNITGGWSLTITAAVNTPPTISDIPNQTTSVNTPLVVPFTISDAESAASQLTLSATSSTTDLVPNSSLVFGGSGNNRTLTVTPAANVYGTSTIQVTVTDPVQASAADTFLFTVTSAGGTVVRIANTFWTSQVDANGNGYYESSRLNWTPEVIGAGSYSVFEKVYSRLNTGSWVLLSTTGVHTITGTGSANQQSFDIVEQPTKVPGPYNYMIELYQAGQGTPEDVKNSANDVGLGGHLEEGLPDLIIYTPTISPTFRTAVYQPTDCAVTHGCTQAGTRRIMDFTMQTRNVGTTDLYLGNPVNNPAFVWDTCHGHYHFQGFATYNLLSGNTLVTSGLKVGFCLEDVGRWDPNVSATPKYICTNQGIQAGWFDNYGTGLTCQWIDITGVPTGTYTLQVEVNPSHLLREANYNNNIGTVEVTITNTVPTISSITTQSTLQNTPTQPIPFTIWDGETDWNSLGLSATSSNPTLLPVGNIAFGGSGVNRTVTLTPAANKSGSTTVTITVTDANGATASSAFTLNVGSNNAPVLTLGGGSVTYVENASPLVVESQVTVSDVDNTHFNGGGLTVDVTANGAAEDRLEIRNQGTGSQQIGVSGNTVTYGGAVIGTFSGGTSGSAPLVVTFTTTSATPAAAQALAANVVYRNVSEDPSVLPRTVRFVLGDGSGGFSAAVSKTVSVVAVNDPPAIALPGGSLSYPAGSAPLRIDTTATAADVDNANFQLGWLKVSLLANGTVDDRLWIQVGGPISVGGSSISYAGVTIGSISGGTGTTPLLINFDIIPSTVTPAVAQDLMRNIVFSNVSSSPSGLPRTVQFEVNDGRGGTATATTGITITGLLPSPPITWSNPADIAYGTALGATQLNATTTVPGTFVYSPAAGSILGAGNAQVLAVTFTPDDLQTYGISHASVLINVTKVPLTITADDKTRAKGLANPALTASYAGFVAGDTPAVLSPGVTLSTTATPASPVGPYPITASGAASPNYTITFNPGVLTVTAPVVTGVTVAPASPTIIVGGTQAFAATAVYTDSTTQDVTSQSAWQSATPAVATVSSAGVATGVSTGTSQISAAYLTFTGATTLTVNPPSQTTQLSNAAAITVPSSGAASPYPSTIVASGLSGVVTKLTVTLNQINHTYPDDLDILLVGPAGQKVMLMSDAGGNPDLVNVTLTFDDSAAGLLPDATQISSGTFKPTNYETTDAMTSPAPAAPYASALSAFLGTNPNGTWSLYVVDDYAQDAGIISGGWGITIVSATNSPPTIASVANQSTQRDTPTAAIPVTVNDIDTGAATVTLTGASSNPTLLPTSGIVFGGSGSNRTVTLTPAPGQRGTTNVTLTASDPGAATAQTSFVLTVSDPSGQISFSNPAAIAVPALGAATPYPSTVTVAGVQGLISEVRVQLIKASHSYPDDFDILLVGPAGQKVLLMSDTGGNPDLVNVTLVLDDAAAASLPDSTLIAAGSYKPTNIGAGDTFAAPAPAGPYASALSAFAGTDPNGVWSLYVVDDEAGDQGSIAGWTLILTPTIPPSPLVAASLPPPATDPGGESANPLRIESVIPMPMGGLKLVLRTQPGQNYVVEYSNDLMTWKELTAGTAVDTTVDIVDDSSAESPMRFYRVQLK